MKNVIFTIFILVFLAACGQNQGSENLYGENEIRDGTTLISNRLDQQEYNTREWTMDAQNPNFPNTDRNRARVNNQTDIDKARQIIEETNEFRSGPIWINGDDMWVTAYKRGIIADRQRVKDASNLREKLIKALPQYHIQIKIQEDRT